MSAATDEMDLGESVKSILLDNLDMAGTIEARKHQYNIIHKISEAMHEIFVQYVWIAHCILLLPTAEQRKLADAIHVSLGTCRKVERYLGAWENIPVELRAPVIEDIEKRILEPVITDVLKQMEVEKP